MKFWVAVTDNNWFRYLAQIKPDEVNFWQPSGNQVFRAVEPGAPFLFKLHSPDDYIAGGGFFVKHSFLQMSLAWEVFGEKNGAPDFQTFFTRVAHRRKGGDLSLNSVIGCIVLNSPFFFSGRDWIPVPQDWSPNLVRGKTYDTDEPVGSELWKKIAVRLDKYRTLHSENQELDVLIREERPIYGTGYLTQARLGQGAFRVLVTDAYSRRCAMTGERTLPALEATHIKPYGKSGPNLVRNGLLLRADLHALFDRGYITIDRDYRIEVSRRIKDDYDNGREYYLMHGRKLIILPTNEIERPSQDFIDWHNQNSFVP